MKISVCMAVHNGGLFLKEQIDSIIHQLRSDDELIVSDDESRDDSLEIIRSFNDPRIRILPAKQFSDIIKTFEYTLRESTGEIIFLADQDDIWASNKIERIIPLFVHYDLVVSDCKIVNEKLEILHDSFFTFNSSGPGLLKNLIRNSYMGCCMAFKNTILKKALPLPSGVIMHDQWLGLIAELKGRVIFYPDKLVLHRRHQYNASTTGSSSRTSLFDKLSMRYTTVKNLIYAR